MNNLEITDAIRAGEITSTSSLLEFLNSSRSQGNSFTEANIQHGFSELAAYKDPEGVQDTQTYKDFSTATERRVVTGLVKAPEFSFMGGYEDQQSLAVQSKYREYEAARIAAIPLNNRRDPTAIRQALEAAAQDTHDYFRQNDPELYADRTNTYAEGVGNGDLPRFSDPNFVTEIQRLAAEQEAAIAEETAAFESMTPVQRDQMITEGNAILFPQSVEQQQFEAGVANVADYIVNTPLDQLDMGQVMAILTGPNVNIQLPRSQDELQFMIDDLNTIQQDLGITFDPAVLDRIISYVSGTISQQ